MTSYKMEHENGYLFLAQLARPFFPDVVIFVADGKLQKTLLEMVKKSSTANEKLLKAISQD